MMIADTPVCTRQSVLHDYVARWKRDTRTSRETVATLVREIYHATVPEPDRAVSFSPLADAYERSRRDAQTLDRLLDKPGAFPVDLEDAVLLALPDRYQQDCINELSGRWGQYSGPMGDDGTAKFESLSKLLKEVSDVVDAMAPALADGKWTPADRAYVARIEKELNDLVGICLAAKRDMRTKVLNANVHPLRG